MPHLRRPPSEHLAEFIAGQASLDFTYPHVGATATVSPDGYVTSHTRVKLGEGEQAFLAACRGLRLWRQFDLGWTSIEPSEAPIEAGQTVCVVARSLGLWWLNATRIVYVVDERGRGDGGGDERGASRRFGFAYGTLPSHAATGEERFLVEMDERGGVWYDVQAFSRPRRWYAWLGYPYLRWVQKRFGPQSARAMKRWTQGSDRDETEHLRPGSERDARAET